MRRRFLFILSLIMCLLVGCVDNNDHQCDSSELYSDSQLSTWKQQDKFAQWILTDPSTYYMNLQNYTDSLSVTITDSPDGKVRFYTWWDGMGGTMICYENIYQTLKNNKVRAYDLRSPEEEAYESFPIAIRQIESSKGTVYLIFSESIVSSSYVVYDVSSYLMNRRGKLMPANVFEYSDETDVAWEDNNVKFTNQVGSDNPTLPYSAFMKNSWRNNFFFDLTNNDIYLYDDNDYYHHYQWNGKIFEYQYKTYNPAFSDYMESSMSLVCELELEKLFVRIDKVDGAYRYIAWEKDSIFTSTPELIIKNGWYHETKKEYHFTNNNYEYIVNTSDKHLRVYKTSPKTGKAKEIADYKIEYLCDYNNGYW